jgi:ribosomal protein S18 acetylase RimI-like enzyme
MNAGIVRRATSVDQRAIDGLMSQVDRLLLKIPWDEVHDALRTHDFFLIEEEGRLGCVWGLSVGPEIVARIQVFALLDGWSVRESLAALLPLVRRVLARNGVETLAFIGMRGWLLEGLLANGFRHVNTILTMQKTDLRVPDPGNARVVVRPASQADIAEILAIDEAAFEPLWRNTEDTLVRHLTECPHFVVARLEGKAVGYQYLGLTGRHGHLTRIAVHPEHYGRQIGVRLLADAVRYFRRRRVYGVTLNTQRDNYRARRLYEWFGFKVIGQEAQVLVCDI